MVGRSVKGNDVIYISAIHLISRDDTGVIFGRVFRLLSRHTDLCSRSYANSWIVLLGDIGIMTPDTEKKWPGLSAVGIESLVAVDRGLVNA